jgi:hypothetical protein
MGLSLTAADCLSLAVFDSKRQFDLLSMEMSSILVKSKSQNARPRLSVSDFLIFYAYILLFSSNLRRIGSTSTEASFNTMFVVVRFYMTIFGFCTAISTLTL